MVRRTKTRTSDSVFGGEGSLDFVENGSLIFGPFPSLSPLLDDGARRVEQRADILEFAAKEVLDEDAVFGQHQEIKRAVYAQSDGQ